jgi:dienelactone hydrolase
VALELGRSGRDRLDRATLRRLLGATPEPAPLDARVEGVVEVDGLVRERVTFQAEAGERIPAFLLRPSRATGPRAGVLCLHQHAGQFEIGKSEPAGLSGNPQQHYALELARRGYVTFTFDQLCFEERVDPRLAGNLYERFEFTRRVTMGSCLQAKMSWDAMRAVDYLVGRPEVDGTRLGCVGHSLGGQQALFLAALDERIRCGVSSCGFASLATVFRDGINHNFGAYVPGLGARADLGDVLALVAPRPFFVGVGRTDRIFPIDGVEASVARARPAFPAGRLELVVEEGGHAFGDAMRERAYGFLGRCLQE